MNCALIRIRTGCTRLARRAQSGNTAITTRLTTAR